MHQPGSHGVQFYDNEPLIQHAIAQYFARDAHPGDQLIMVSRPRTYNAVGEHLASGRYGPTIPTDRILFIDAEAVLSQVMDGETFDKTLTERLFKQVLSQVSLRDTQTIRLYGELVDLLCQHKHHASALQLEGVGGDLIHLEPRLSIFCGYAKARFGYANDADFQAVCRKHTHVFPSEASTATPAEPVYLIEDNATLRTALNRLLTSSRRCAHTFESAEKFLAELDKLAPGCLVVDVHLPGMSGLELIGRLIDAGVSWPIIVMSGSRDQRIKSEALRLGARDFLHKPFEPLALLEAIAQL